MKDLLIDNSALVFLNIFESRRGQNFFLSDSRSILSHSFSPWRSDLLANEDLMEVIQEGRSHGLNQWKKGRKSGPQGLLPLSLRKGMSVYNCQLYYHWMIMVYQ